MDELIIDNKPKRDNWRRSVWADVALCSCASAEETYVSVGLSGHLKHVSRSHISWMKKWTCFPSWHRLLTRELSRVRFYTFQPLKRDLGSPCLGEALVQVWRSDPPSSRFKGKFINQVEPKHNADRMTFRFITAVKYGITVKCVCCSHTCTTLIYSMCGPDRVLHLLKSSRRNIHECLFMWVWCQADPTG